MFAHLAAYFDYSTVNMNILDKIRDADPRTRVSFLHPDRAAESICDIQELREAIQAQVYNEGIQQIVQQGNAEISAWAERDV